MHKAMLSTRSKIATIIFFLMGHLLKEHELKHMIHDCILLLLFMKTPCGCVK